MNKYILLIAMTLFAQIALCNTMDMSKTFDYSKVRAEFKPASDGMFSERAYYGLILFGKKGKIPMWVVADFSDKNSVSPYIVYIDRDFDGVVGEEGEKFIHKKTRLSSYFVFHDWVNPVTKEKENIRVYLKNKGNKKLLIDASFNIKGYESDCSILASNSIENAGMVLAGFERKLELLNPYGETYSDIFYYEKGNVGNAPSASFNLNKRTFIIGRKGTNGSLWRVSIAYLPKDEPIVSTLKYTDKTGKKRKYVNFLKGRC